MDLAAAELGFPLLGDKPPGAGAVSLPGSRAPSPSTATWPLRSMVSHCALTVVGIQQSLLRRVVWSEIGLKINTLISKTPIHQVCGYWVKSTWGEDSSYVVNCRAEPGCTQSWYKAAFLILIQAWLSPPLQHCFRNTVSSSSTRIPEGKSLCHLVLSYERPLPWSPLEAWSTQSSQSWSLSEGHHIWLPSDYRLHCWGKYLSPVQLHAVPQGQAFLIC